MLKKNSQPPEEQEAPPISPDTIWADTHVGLVRELNEDSYAYYADPNEINSIVTIADGIGGHQGGHLASHLCLRMIISSWRNLDVGQNESEEELHKFLEMETELANDCICCLNHKLGIQQPMGTTIVAGIFAPASLLIAHAGDSRCYRLRDGKIEQLTDDHSFVAELLRKNVISEEEALTHPFAHIISKSVGPALGLKAEINTFDRKSGDRFIFCTDGLTNHVSDAEIEKALLEDKNPHDCVKHLMAQALHGGGEDNVTVVCVFG